MADFSPRDARPEGQLVAAFFRQTYSVRLFRSQTAALDHYPRMKVGREMFLCAEDLKKAFSPFQIAMHLDQLTTPRDFLVHDARDRAAGFDRVPGELPEVALWRALQHCGDKVMRRPGESGQDFYKMDFTVLEASTEAVAKLPKQARVILAEISRLNETTFTEERAKEIVDNLWRTGTLKTKQDPFRIFAYYAPTYYDLGIMWYKGRRKDDEDEGGEEQDLAA